MKSIKTISYKHTEQTTEAKQLDELLTAYKLKSGAEDIDWDDDTIERAVEFIKHKVSFIESKKGWCSRGCSWTTSFYLNADFSITFFGKKILIEKKADLIIRKGDYIEWGTRPDPFSPKLDGSLFDIEIYKMKDTEKYFVYAGIPNCVRKNSSEIKWQKNYFLIKKK